ncbi:hypothetical protein R6Q57_018610 [Mikania cordata]
MDISWQMAMAVFGTKKFIKKYGRLFKKKLDKFMLLEHLKTQLSKTKIHADKYEYASTSVPSMVDFQCRKKEKIGLDFTAVTPPFNHNYSIMPNINTFVDDLLIKSDRRCDFTTGSNIPIPLTTDPVETDPNISDDSEVYGDSLNDTGLRGKNEERSAGKST